MTPEDQDYEYDTITNPSLRMLEMYWPMASHSGWEVHEPVKVSKDGRGYVMVLKKRKGQKS